MVVSHAFFLFSSFQVHNSPKCLGSVYSCYRSISLFFSNQEEIRIYGHEIKMNGIRYDEKKWSNEDGIGY